MNNKYNDRLIEILAPAKNLQYGIEAIKAGADSVYIACEKFGLRKHFQNSIDDIKKLCEFAHKYWAKVYVTLNSTIHNDDDFEYIKETINELYKMGADAIIISDMGILTLELPPIPIFASVNTLCFSAEKINFMDKVGISRIILPRELTFEEIKEIRQKTKIPLEVFIHGTFCVAYSGNCYFKYGQSLKRTNSSKTLQNYQENSSNSGSCIVNCTDIYNLIDAEDNYIVKNERLLGLRFLNLIDELDNFITNGVHSFKIEGRQRDLAYVKNITALCNYKVNEVLKDKKHTLKRLSSGTSVVSFEPKLNNIYNRGFTNYFFNGRKKENLSIYEPFGNPIGKITSIKDGYFKLNSETILNVGDRVLFYKKGEPTFLDNIIDKKDNSYKINSQDFDTEYSIYRIIDSKIKEDIEQAESYRYISANMTVNRNENNYIFSVIDEDGIKAEEIIDFSQNHKISKYEILEIFNNEKNLFKTESIISPDVLQINPADITTIKEKIYNALTQERLKARPVDYKQIDRQSDVKYPEILTYLDNVCNQKAVQFYKQHGIENPEMGLESSKEIEGKQIYTGRYCIRYELGYCSKLKNPNTPKLPWYLEDKYQNKYKIEFDCAKCEMHILY